MAGQVNWAGNYRYRAPDLSEPTTVDEARRIVAAASRVRPLGTRHSFNSLPDTRGVLMDLGRLPADPVIDRDAMTVTVGGGVRFGVLADYLERNGYALHNLGSLPHISVAGATATSTHGSGDGNGTLSTAVCGLQLIAPGGDLWWVDRSDPRFDGVVVSLGGLGPVVRISFDIQPSYLVRQDAFIDLPWSVAIDRLDEVMGAGYSVSLLTHWGTPTVAQTWVKTRLDLTDRVPDLDHLGARADLRPRRENETEFGSPGPWSLRLPHFRLDATPSLGEEIQVEWLIPRSNARSVLEKVRERAHLIDPLLAATEVRTVAADRLWLSPAFERHAIAIHFTFRREAEAVDALLPELEPLFLAAGGRPHWGKVFHAGVRQVGPLYPRLEQWRGLRHAIDPGRKFVNGFLVDKLGV